MCANDMYECQKASSSYDVILPKTYAPLTLPRITINDDRIRQETEAMSISRPTTTVPISISKEVHRAFPESGSFGSYGKAGLAC
ncbi:unnamed protein product [Heligmosomoides polygyrus]|uniref:Uncharacterized protein n=1 Tax=Heligmosomoides polygyrus TaxID=6339 RepID=A0A183FEM4_HELPZ|nr:unnamed protein product [Heligmosomoides polygyrus]